MTYYIEKDKKIVLHDTDKARIENTLKFMPQYQGLELQETERPIENCEWADGYFIACRRGLTWGGMSILIWKQCHMPTVLRMTHWI